MNKPIISFDIISKEDAYCASDSSAVEQNSESGINIHFHIEGDNNNTNITFGEIKKRGGVAEFVDNEEVEQVCDNVAYATGEYCETYCFDCKENGAVYDTGSTWHVLPFLLKVVTLPLVLPFVTMGSMRYGTQRLIIAEDAIEYKPTGIDEINQETESKGHTSSPELTESDMKFIDTVCAITGTEPIYTREVYNELMWGGYQDDESQEQYDIFSNPENQHLLKKVS